MRRRCRGFTLIELLVVIVIIAVLASLLGNMLIALLHTARYRQTETLIRALDSACETYRVMYACWPPASPYTGSQNLHFYLGSPRDGTSPCVPEGPPVVAFRADWLDPGAPLLPNPPAYVRDGWGRVIEYTCPGANNPKAGDIRSPGRDPLDPGDDVGNWGAP